MAQSIIQFWKNKASKAVKITKLNHSSDETNIDPRRCVDVSTGRPRWRKRLRRGCFKRFVDLGLARFGR